ncbi:HAD-superfamily hydrolase [Legionella busanensis]|uniref:HAD-superfamily hydrolase n=1 Tax=Legionella busanensis TaxID=190655 RepID=A0A378JS97_9GAMM|nr:HAD hydrolase-like protein [Legionella busanensis]STX51042.1 HAD-superfamily hydrolase [Legionella busanensis]
MLIDKNFNLIFDFDGTLADSFSAVLKKFSLLASELNFHDISETEIDKLRNLSSRELIKSLKIPFYKLPKVLRKARKALSEDIHGLPIFADIPEVLTKLQQLNCTLGILTSNSEENVLTWLNHYKIQSLFSFIHAESSYFGKKRVLKKIIKTYQMPLLSTFYIGDETRDIEAAQKANINSMAVNWGFNSEETLKQYHPNYLAKTPKDILNFILGIIL